MRVNATGEIRMPPLARETIDEKGVALLRQWITSLPGRPVVDPPQISPAGGTYKTPVQVSLNVNEPGADIRYTLDGSTPTASDARYDQPLEITGPTVVRARAFKEGYTRSIASQAVFIVAAGAQ
jgi:Chitobiase/beta-hexosaminidase C-terminal domain